MVDQKDFT
jgi:hypothetical protein